MKKTEIESSKAVFKEMALLWNLRADQLVDKLFIIQHPSLPYSLNMKGEAYTEQRKELRGLIKEKLNNGQWSFPKNVSAEINEGVREAFDDPISHAWFVMRQDSNIDDPATFGMLRDQCLFLSKVYQHYVTNSKDIDFDVLLDMEHLSLVLTQVFFELLGYWKAQMENRAIMSNRGKPGAEKKKAIKAGKVFKIKEIMSKYPHYKTDKKQRQAFRMEAMRETDSLSTRTIDNYEKELEGGDE
jgi:hypothetical protein